MIDELRYKRLKLIKDLTRNPLFKDIEAEIRMNIASEFLSTAGGEGLIRDQLYAEGKAFDRLLGRLQALANEVTVEESKVGSNG